MSYNTDISKSEQMIKNEVVYLLNPVLHHIPFKPLTRFDLSQFLIQCTVQSALHYCTLLTHLTLYVSCFAYIITVLLTTHNYYFLYDTFLLPPLYSYLSNCIVCDNKSKSISKSILQESCLSWHSDGGMTFPRLSEQLSHWLKTDLFTNFINRALKCTYFLKSINSQYFLSIRFLA